MKDKIELPNCPNFSYFGASYPDAECHEGYLWDLDKFEDDHLYNGGEEPCPFCNTKAFIRSNTDALNGSTRKVLVEYVRSLCVKHNYPVPKYISSRINHPQTSK